MRRWLLLATLPLAACGAGPVAQPPTASPTPIPSLPAVVPANPPLECGAEAAIALAQAQSDLALAAVAEVDAMSQSTTDSAVIARTGREAFGQALDSMRVYEVPECLSQAKEFAMQSFAERVAAYDAMGTGDSAGYETHLNNGEAARQNMIAVVNAVLGQ